MKYVLCILLYLYLFIKLGRALRSVVRWLFGLGHRSEGSHDE